MLQVFSSECVWNNDPVFISQWLSFAFWYIILAFVGDSFVDNWHRNFFLRDVPLPGNTFTLLHLGSRLHILQHSMSDFTWKDHTKWEKWSPSKIKNQQNIYIYSSSKHTNLAKTLEPKSQVKEKCKKLSPQLLWRRKMIVRNLILAGECICLVCFLQARKHHIVFLMCKQCTGVGGRNNTYSFFWRKCLGLLWLVMKTKFGLWGTLLATKLTEMKD